MISKAEKHLAAAIVLLVPAAAYTSLFLHHFYIQGAYFPDTGYYAQLAWRDGPALKGNWFSGYLSNYVGHVSPIFSLLTELSRLVPLARGQYYAGFLGLCHGLLAFSAYWVVAAGLPARTRGECAGAALGALLFAFSGPVLAIAVFPHPEILLAAGLILLLGAFSLGNPHAAWAALILCLAVREDGGGHIFAFCAALALLRRQCLGWPTPRLLALFGGIGLVYMILAVIGQRLIFAHDDSLLLRIYVHGDPANGGTLTPLPVRLLLLPYYRAYLAIPFGIILLWAGWLRDWRLLGGYIACLPWIALQLASPSSITDTLSGHYPFPLLAAEIWPFAWTALRRHEEGWNPGRQPPFLTLGIFCAISLGSLVGIGNMWNPGHMELLDGFTHPPSSIVQARTETAVSALHAAAPNLGRLIVDQAILSLDPHYPPQDCLLSHTALGRPDTVAYFDHGFEAAPLAALAAASGLTHHYRIADTSLAFASRLPLDKIAGFGSLLVPEAPKP